MSVVILTFPSPHSLCLSAHRSKKADPSTTPPTASAHPRHSPRSRCHVWLWASLTMCGSLVLGNLINLPLRGPVTLPKLRVNLFTPCWNLPPRKAWHQPCSEINLYRVATFPAAFSAPTTLDNPLCCLGPWIPAHSSFRPSANACLEPSMQELESDWNMERNTLPNLVQESKQAFTIEYRT